MLTSAVVDRDSEDLTPWVAAMLLEIERDLAGDLRLGTLAQSANASPFQFHRRFAKTAGETPKRRVVRLRLERAAQLLRTTDQRVLDIGLAVGFNSHEAFTRAFKRAFGSTPSTWRAALRRVERASAARNRDFRGVFCQLSEVRFERRSPRTLLAIRQLGAYAGFPPRTRARLWDELRVWARARGIAASGENLGLFPDDPMVTPDERQSADYCIPIEGPLEAHGRIRCLTLEGGLYAVVEHFGPYETMIQAYRALRDAIGRSGSYLVRDAPPAQVFLTTAEGGNPSANRSQVWMPVQARR